MLKALAIVILVAAGSYALLWLLSWAEYRRSMSERELGGSTMTNAFLSVQALFEPAKQHIIQERVRQEDGIDRSESGDPPLK